MNSVILSVGNLYVSLHRKEILRDISLEIKSGEQWAIFGAAGSGKTVFAHTLAGNHAFKGRITFPAAAEGKAVFVVDTQHRFRNLQNQSDFYYQQRYNAFDSLATKTVAEELAHYEEHGNGNLSKSRLTDIFHLSSLMDEPLIQLSNGENKRLQILKAVLSSPYLLLLDEPYTGLDKPGRAILDNLLNTLAASGYSLILFSSRSHIPECINQFAILENGNLQNTTTAPELNWGKSADPEKWRQFPTYDSFHFPDFRYAVRMRNVHVRYDGKSILENINWEVKKGSCWALTGANGAGKSTLLSLITGDNPQAYANEIYLFDRKRGSGESIWEIKQKIGFLSPELQLYFDPGATAFTALASGLFDTIGLFRQLGNEQELLVQEWLSYLGCSAYGHRLLTSLPSGLQRLILLGRALIRKPPLLILDEPCQGLDAEGTALTLDTINRFCGEFGATLIFVSHYTEDFPACITHHFSLEKNKIA